MQDRLLPHATRLRLRPRATINRALVRARSCRLRLRSVPPAEWPSWAKSEMNSFSINGSMSSQLRTDLVYLAVHCLPSPPRRRDDARDGRGGYDCVQCVSVNGLQSGG